MLRGVDLDHIETAPQSEQGEESAEVAVEGNLFQHVFPQCAHPTGDIAEAPLGESLDQHVKGTALHPVDPGVTPRPAARHGQVCPAPHCVDQPRKRRCFDAVVRGECDDDPTACAGCADS